jgi:hypothetical protein
MSSVYLSELLRLGGVDVRGELDPATQFRRISYHSQRDVGESLFVALKGERVDGHQFVGDAAANGAIAALVAREWADAQREIPVPLLVVDDPVATLQDLARALPWFVEQAFASALGPIIGQRVADAGRRLLAFPEYAATRIGDSVVSYARDEAGLLAHGDELRMFAAQNARLSERTDELAVRLDRLAAKSEMAAAPQRRLKGTS